MVVSMVGTSARISATPLGCGSRAKVAIKKLEFVRAGQTPGRKLNRDTVRPARKMQRWKFRLSHVRSA
jgi:hypothetical protein